MWACPMQRQMLMLMILMMMSSSQCIIIIIILLIIIINNKCILNGFCRMELYKFFVPTGIPFCWAYYLLIKQMRKTPQRTL